MGLNITDVEPIERDVWAVYEVEEPNSQTVRQDHRIVGMAVDGSEDTNDAVLLTVLPDGHVEPVTRIADNETLLGVAYTDKRRKDLLNGQG